MDDTGEWSSESEGLDEEHKREQAEDIKKATRSEHRSYSRVVQVQLPRPRDDQHVGKSKSEERKSDDRPAWAGVQHHLRGNRTTTRGVRHKKETDGEESRSVCWKLGHRNYRRGRSGICLRRAEKKGEKAQKFSM